MKMLGAYEQIDIAGGDTATPLNLEKRIQFIRQFLVPGRVRLLDCGCGTGEYVHELRHRYQIDAWGIEYSEEKVSKAKQSNPSAASIQAGSITDLDFPDSAFDMILLNEVMEHLPEEGKALSEVFRVLRPGGRLILFSPNRWYPFETHGVYVKNTLWKLKPYVPFIPYLPLPVGKYLFDYWARNYWQRELRSIIEEHGFHVIHHSFIWQTFENISGDQPFLISRSKRLLRAVADRLEKTPLLQRFGTSQAIVATKATG